MPNKSNDLSYLELLAALSTPRSSSTPAPTQPDSWLRGLGDLLSRETPKPAEVNWRDLMGLGPETSPSPSPLADLFRTGQATVSRGLGADMFNGLLAPSAPPQPWSALSLLQPAVVPKKRNVFFSFHYDDVMRVNNVRHSEQFRAKLLEVDQSFYDRSLWESVKRTDPASLKKLIRDGVVNSSVICVLIGTETWSRRWVRYEIARAIIDGKGLAGVHINGISHHKTRRPHPLGYNPFEAFGIAKTQSGFRLAEFNVGGWELYADHASPVSVPPYLPVPMNINEVIPLARGVPVYDWAAQGGSTAIPHWMDHAAKLVGR